MVNIHPVRFISGDIESAEKLRKVIKGFDSNLLRDDGVVVEWDTSINCYPQKLDEIEIEGELFIVGKVRYQLQGDIEHYIFLPGHTRLTIITLCSE